MIEREAEHTRSFVFAMTGDAMARTQDIVPVTSFFGSFAVHTLLIISCYDAGGGSLGMKNTAVTLGMGKLAQK
jgi:hypothetical protein